MEPKDKRKLENELVVMGLAGLSNPDLIQQLADLVSAWPGDKHDYLMGLINECEPAQRSEMYEAIVPKLKFKALSLGQYEAQIALKAGQMVSQGRMRIEGERPRPIEIGGHLLAVVPKKHATGAVATLRCHRCNKSEQFLGDTPAGAMILARKAGWVREPGINKEVCAECGAGVAQAEIVALSRHEQLVVNEKRRVN